MTTRRKLILALAAPAAAPAAAPVLTPLAGSALSPNRAIPVHAGIPRLLLIP